MKDIIRKICGVPIVGGWVALLIGLILPLIPFILVSEVTGMSQEVLLMFGGLAIAGWNYFLKKSDTINITLPVIPVPVWIFGIGIAVVPLGFVVTGNQFS